MSDYQSMTWEELEEDGIWNVRPSAPVYTTREKLGAQFSLENMVGGILMNEEGVPIEGFEPEDGFNPSRYLTTLEPEDSAKRLNQFSIIHEAQSQAEADWRLDRYDDETLQREIRATMGTWENLWTGAFAGITDPIVLATMFVPVLKASQTAMQAAKAVGALSVVEQGAIEVGLSTLQHDRTLMETGVNMAAAGVFGSIFGGFGSAFYKGSNFTKDIADEQKSLIASGFYAEPDIPIRDVLAAYNRGRGPAFDSKIDEDPGVTVAEFHTIEEMDAAIDEIQMANQGFFSKVPFISHINPIASVFNSKSNVEHIVMMSDLAGADFYTKGNIAGKIVQYSNKGSATSAINRAEGRFQLGQIVPLRKGYDEWSAIPGKTGGFVKGQIDGWDRYNAEISDWMRIWKTDSHNAPKWVKTLFEGKEGLLNENLLYRDHLLRTGFFNDTIQKSDDVKIKIDEANTTRKAAKKKRDDARAREPQAIKEGRKLNKKQRGTAENIVKTKKAIIEEQKAEIRMLRARHSLLVRHENGDIEASRELITDLTGTDEYLPQIHNKEAAMDDKADWIVTMKKAEDEWYVERLGELKAAGNKVYEFNQLEAEYKVIKDGLLKDGDQRYEEAWKQITKDNSPVGIEGFEARALTPGRARSRELRIKQATASKYLSSNYIDITMAHYSTVLPHIELKNRGLLGGTDEASLARVARAEAQTELKKQGKSKKERREIDRVHARSEKNINAVRDVILHRNYKDVTQNTRDWTYMIQSFLSMTQLGGMLIPSLGDSAGTVAKTGVPHIARAIEPWLRNLKGEFTANEAARMVGIVDLHMSARMHALQTSSELGINQGVGARIMGRLSNKFYKATAILHWNQGMKELAIFGAMDEIIRHAYNPSMMSKVDRMKMARDGWGDEELRQLADLHRRYDMETEGAVILNTGKIYEEWSNARSLVSRKQLDLDAELADRFNSYLSRHAERAIVTPGAGDLPKFFTSHPIFRLMGQYKGFGFASVNKTTIPMVQGMMAGDAHQAFGFLGLTLLGTGSYMLRQKMYDREISENWQTLAWEGLLKGGAIGIYSDGLAVSQKVTGNWAGLGDKLGVESPSRYYARGFITDILGPSVGLIESVGYTANALSRAAGGEQLTDVDYARAWRMVPFNNLFYLRSVLERF